MPNSAWTISASVEAVATAVSIGSGGGALPTAAEGYLYNDGFDVLSWNVLTPFPADSVGWLANDGSGVLSWEVVSTVSLPADAEGYLYDDGSGNLSWETPPSPLPADAEGFLYDDGYGALTWEPVSTFVAPVDAEGYLYDDGAGNLSWETPPSPLPADAEGYLYDDGAGNLSWETPSGSLPADAEGYLYDDGVGNLSWEPVSTFVAPADAEGYLYDDGVGNLSWEWPVASHVVIPDGVGTPTYNDLQDFLNICQAGGRLTGGVLTPHAGPNGTLDISAMEGMIHTAGTLGSPLIYFKKAAVASIALPDNAVSYIWITYSGGTLTYSANAARPTADYNVWVVGQVWRAGNNVEVLTAGQNIYNMYGRQQDRLLIKYNIMDHASGGVISAHATPLRLQIEAGIWYDGNTRIDTVAKSTVQVWYKNGTTTWVESTAMTLWSDIFNVATATIYETYQNGNSLGALSANKYGVYWIFICPQGDLYVVLGTSTYANIGAAQAATVPSDLPPYCVNWARFAGRVIIKNADTAFHSVESVFGYTFTLSSVVDHASLTHLAFADSGHTGFMGSTTDTTLTGAGTVASPLHTVGLVQRVLTSDLTVSAGYSYIVAGPLDLNGHILETQATGIVGVF